MVALLRLLFWPIVLLLLQLISLSFHWDMWGVIYRWFMHDPLEASIGIITIYWLFTVTRRWVRFLYAYLMSAQLVSVKVMLPRSDSKIDQEKRTEKDFKEKVAIMEQLYRALWEVKTLTFWRHVHFWIFRYATISFELYLENGELTFYVLSPPGLVSIVEKQITAFYSDAEVTVQETPEIWQRGQKLVAYNMQLKKKFIFPVRFYEEMQDDPLNDVANVLSKTEPGETACLQVIITPTFSERWSKVVKRHASTKFKGKEDRWVSRI
ncbi:MAG TPA: hypothetical protein VI873_03085, partial [Candidatus Peribacteraceae bacterium]|nr:hypothetical protein [Candidatus Peribacteraceae bacterium]